MAAASISMVDLQSFKVADLKRELKALGLSVAGNKTDLIERLQQALSSELHASRQEDLDHSSTELDDTFEGTDNVNEDEVLEDDVLLGEDHKHPETHDINEEELLATKLEGDAMSNSSLQHDLNTPDLDDISTADTGTMLSSKLDKKETTSLVGTKTVVIASKAENKMTQGSSIVPKKAEPEIVKKLTQEERLALRAKRFSSSSAPPDDAKLKARAERFGIQSKSTVSGTKSSPNKPIGSAPVDFERLKKRAERFGTSVSAVMKQIEEKEKILKRKQRFGTLVSTSLSADEQERKKLRAERFAMA